MISVTVRTAPPLWPSPTRGRHLNAQANIKYNYLYVNLTMIELYGGQPSVVDGAIHGPSQNPDSSDAYLADSASAIRAQIESPNSKVGLVGPKSNYAAPPQLVENVPYRDIPEMHDFARAWRDKHRGQWFTVPKLSGFCLFMKRAVYEAIGGLDERFGLGFFDDDDLAERARRAGFDLAVAHDLFVHHFGSRTFAGNGVNAEKLLDENAGRFAAKWGLAGTNGRRVSLWPFVDSRSTIPDSSPRPESEEISRKAAKPAKNKNGFAIGPTGDARAAIITSELIPSSSSAPLRLSVSSSSLSAASSTNSRERPKVSLTVIARNKERYLPSCLESVQGLFDEIVVIDTGSHDRTTEIARLFGANVFEFAWIDDFAAARNEALARATSDYAFWLDADDVVDPAQREKLRTLLNQ
jgi:GT2 family glycosyltransferase